VETPINQSQTEKTYECTSCNQKVEQPILAQLHSGTTTEEYYACPRCLTKVGEPERDNKAKADEVEEEAALPVEEATIVVAEKTEETQICPYHLGYLRKREKGAPIPEDCFTCSKMIECI
jgi:DNA-directed RNA polymerase subunit RPC12/RpoP